MLHLLRRALVVLTAVFLPQASALAAITDYYPKRVWEGTYGGELNISVLVYRDLNFNGVYDLGDRPMTGVAVELTGGGKFGNARSNLAGFANFRMSATQQGMEITSPGEYRFEVVPPAGSVITSKNAVQTSMFEKIPGAPGDMHALTPPVPVGIAPDLHIAGRLPVPGKSAITVIGPDKTQTTVEADAEGKFDIPAAPGIWTLSAAGKDGPIERQIEVTDAPVYVGQLQPTAPAGTRTQTATFDDVVGMGVRKVPTGYAGVRWSNFVAAQQEFYGGEGYVNTARSGEFVGYGGSGHAGTISSDKPFTFAGGYFGVSWSNAEGETLNVRAWRGDDLVFEDSVALSSILPVYYAPNFSGITRIEFSTAHYWQFVCDNLQLLLDQ